MIISLLISKIISLQYRYEPLDPWLRNNGLKSHLAVSSYSPPVPQGLR